MKGVAYLLVSVACCLLAVWCGLTGWKVFSISHFLAVDATYNIRAMRDYGPQPAFWRDHLSSLPLYIPSLVIGLFTIMCGYFGSVCGWLSYCIFRRKV